MSEDDDSRPMEIVIGTYEQFLIGYQVKGDAVSNSALMALTDLCLCLDHD